MGPRVHPSRNCPIGSARMPALNSRGRHNGWRGLGPRRAALEWRRSKTRAGRHAFDHVALLRAPGGPSLWCRCWCTREGLGMAQEHSAGPPRPAGVPGPRYTSAPSRGEWGACSSLAAETPGSSLRGPGHGRNMAAPDSASTAARPCQTGPALALGPPTPSTGNGERSPPPCSGATPRPTTATGNARTPYGAPCVPWDTMAANICLHGALRWKGLVPPSSAAKCACRRPCMRGASATTASPGVFTRLALLPAAWLGGLESGGPGACR